VRVKAHKLYDEHFDNWLSEIEDHWNYNDLIADTRLRKYYISFDGVLADPDSDLVYVGITSFNAEIFKAFDRRTGTFIDFGYEKIADPFDAKFHRALIKSKDGCIYGAIALLHDVNDYWNAPGGAIVRYNPKTGELKKIGIPVPHVYVQGMAIDEQRRIAYLQTFTPEYLASFHLDTCESRILGLTGSGLGMGQGETIALDYQGRVWGAWGITRAWQQHGVGPDQNRLYRYNPASDRIEFFTHGLPQLEGRYGFAGMDGIFAASNRMIYAGTGEGGLCRINPDTAEVKLLGAPCPPKRIAAFAERGGCLYGIGGRFGNASLFRMDLSTEKYELLGKLHDPELDVSAWQIHDMSIAPDGAIFAGENDTMTRSAYLWEINL